MIWNVAANIESFFGKCKKTGIYPTSRGCQSLQKKEFSPLRERKSKEIIVYGKIYLQIIFPSTCGSLLSIRSPTYGPPFSRAWVSLPTASGTDFPLVPTYRWPTLAVMFGYRLGIDWITIGVRLNRPKSITEFRPNIDQNLTRSKARGDGKGGGMSFLSVVIRSSGEESQNFIGWCLILLF